MLKKFIAIVAAFVATSAFAAVDLNKASQADLESIKGIGPSLSTRILDERKKGDFKSWSDFVGRIKGVGEGNANRLSEAGLVINGTAFKTAAAPAAAVAPAAAKPEARK